MTVDNGRRVNVKDSANSLAVLKPLGGIPHSGGKRFAKGGAEYRTLVAWIRAGGPLYPRGETRRLPVERAYSLLPYRPSPPCCVSPAGSGDHLGPSQRADYHSSKFDAPTDR